jgi:uncharacterized protein YjcR
MELSIEEQYERFQKLYVRYETIAPSNSPIEQTIYTIATLKNEIIIPEIQVQEEVKNDQEDVKNDQENLKEKIETICEVCGGRYSYFNRNRHINTKKHQNSLHLLSFPPSPLLEREQTVQGSSP